MRAQHEPIVLRDPKPEIAVEITVRLVVDPRRRRRVGEILAKILDREITPGDADRP